MSVYKGIPPTHSGIADSVRVGIYRKSKEECPKKINKYESYLFLSVLSTVSHFITDYKGVAT